MMRMSIVALASAAAFTTGAPALCQAQGAKVANPKVVKICEPPGGNWGPGGTVRSKIHVFSDNTAVYMTQNFATTTPDRWWTARFAASGGQFTNSLGSQNAVTQEGDGYKVQVQSRSAYSAHFACVLVR